MTFLDFLPYKVAFYNHKLQRVYSNHKSDGTFFPTEDEVLPAWLWQELERSPQNTVHIQVPTTAFEQVLIQSYQALYDEAGTFQGVMETVQDLKPLLSSYLNHSGQALVGWSDVTSGASLSGQFHDSETSDDVDSYY